MLDPAIAAPPDVKAALKHDDDFGIARRDLAEVAFGVPPAFREQPVPPAIATGPEPGPGGVLDLSMAGYANHTASPQGPRRRSGTCAAGRGRARLGGRPRATKPGCGRTVLRGRLPRDLQRLEGYGGRARPRIPHHGEGRPPLLEPERQTAGWVRNIVRPVGQLILSVDRAGGACTAGFVLADVDGPALAGAVANSAPSPVRFTASPPIGAPRPRGCTVAPFVRYNRSGTSLQ